MNIDNVRKATRDFDSELRGKILVAFCDKELAGIEYPQELALFFAGYESSRNSKISKTMKGNSNAVKTFEKVSKQMKTDKNRGKQIETDGNSSKQIEQKTKFLDFVYLTQEEHDRLIKNYGPVIANSMIQRLNDYIGQIGESKAKAKYKSHYFTIMNRTRRDGGDKVNVAREQALQEHRKKIQQEILDSNQSQNGESIQESGFDRRAEIGC